MSRSDYKGLGKSARKKAKAGILPPGGELRPVERGPEQVARHELSVVWREAGGAMALATACLDERKACWDAIWVTRRSRLRCGDRGAKPTRTAVAPAGSI